jgi:hypothetical protein
MAKQNYKEIEKRIEGMREFNGHSLCGVFNQYETTTHYSVYSYDRVELLYVCIDRDGALVWFNKHRFSVTTSKHQNLVERAFAGQLEELKRKGPNFAVRVQVSGRDGERTETIFMNGKQYETTTFGKKVSA